MDVKRAWLEAMLENGVDIPEPREYFDDKKFDRIKKEDNNKYVVQKESNSTFKYPLKNMQMHCKIVDEML